ncbi:MAG: hypothetical protein M1832_006081 [Thelocarpon impressellum]|nr:MAG: hypothetical protein M1832_006081 [Thelocarpon impressellum]
MAAMPADEVWSSWVELGVRVRGLPFSVTTLELWNVFNKEGKIDFIELSEDLKGSRDGTAKIRFRPMDPNVTFPERTILEASSIDFGFMYGITTMMSMHQTFAQEGIKIFFELNLSRKVLDIQFDLQVVDPRNPGQRPLRRVVQRPLEGDVIGGLNRIEKYRFRIPLEQLQTIHETRRDNEGWTLAISLDHPPNFYRKAVGDQLLASHDAKSGHWSEWDTWFRTTDIVYDPAEIRDAALALRKPKPLLDIGRWTTYRLAFKRTVSNVKNYHTLCAALRDYNIRVKGNDVFAVISQREPAVWQWIDKPQRKPNPTNSSLAELEEATVPLLPFPVRYQLEVCISQGFLNEHNLSKAFIEKLAGLEGNKAQDILEYVAQQKTRVYEPMSLFDVNIIKGSASRPKIPHYCTYTRKATVTPSMVYYSTPQVETSNRVIRQYVEHADRFIRVQFTDEKFQGRIHSTEKNTYNEVLTRVQRAMNNGLRIGDRHFEFLAFGNSQFRENGAYFFAPTPFLNAEKIRDWMGNFTSIRTPAKYAARLGQCFSTTRAIHGARVQLIEIPDRVKTFATKSELVAESNFTDGVGKISEFIAQMVGGELHLPSVPSVIQFRLGGCKGVLAVWPETKGRQLQIRPSQYKFPALHSGLEINRWSQYSAATLNRQIILILSALGVDDGVFTQKQEKMLSDLERATRDEVVAVNLLQKYIDPNQMTIALAGMILDGFMKAGDPFTLSLVQLWRTWSIKYLKEKAKILIDEGAYLLGCTDETQTLRGHYDEMQVGPRATMAQRLASLPEIFVQIPNRDKPGQYTVIESICILARNPSLHPGDIRVVKAVDNPRLHHLRDVVVLPQLGDRDIASMCSGGDLDGDDYLVMWDKEIIPREWNHPPMDYTAPKAKEMDRDVTTRDIVNFFVNYMKNDRLGTIAVAHMAQADRLGVKDLRCTRLAALHSKAVDYVKSGEPAFMPRELAPPKFPHFMESKYRSKEKTYVSKKVLGKLFDQVERVDFVPAYEGSFDARILNAYDLDNDLLEQARDLKQQYDADVRRTMAQYDIRTEFEVWSTFVLHYSETIRDYKFHEEMGQISTALKDRYRDACIKKAGGKEFEKLGPFVAAMYKVTQEEVHDALIETRQMRIVGGEEVPVRELAAKSMPMMSFPWCFDDVLGKIATHQFGDRSEEQRRASQGPYRHTNGKPAEQLVDPFEEDVVETADGVTHRGDTLILFQHEQSEGEESKMNDGTVPGQDTAGPASETLAGNSEADKLAKPSVGLWQDWDIDALLQSHPALAPTVEHRPEDDLMGWEASHDSSRHRSRPNMAASTLPLLDLDDPAPEEEGMNGQPARHDWAWLMRNAGISQPGPVSNPGGDIVTALAGEDRMTDEGHALAIVDEDSGEQASGAIRHPWDDKENEPGPGYTEEGMLSIKASTGREQRSYTQQGLSEAARRVIETGPRDQQFSSTRHLEKIELLLQRCRSERQFNGAPGTSQQLTEQGKDIKEENGGCQAVLEEDDEFSRSRVPLDEDGENEVLAGEVRIEEGHNDDSSEAESIVSLGSIGNGALDQLEELIRE